MTKKKDEKITARMSREELQEFETLLVQRRTQLRGDVEKLETDALKKGGFDNSGELSTLPLHMADLGTDSFERDMSLGLIENEADELREIEEALVRIKDGTYGVCPQCKRQIPKARLRAIPHAMLCVECKQKQEGKA